MKNKLIYTVYVAVLRTLKFDYIGLIGAYRNTVSYSLVFFSSLKLRSSCSSVLRSRGCSFCKRKLYGGNASEFTFTFRKVARFVLVPSM